MPGRKPKQGLDYFSFDTHLDDKFGLIEAEFGLKGFAVVVKIFQKIYGEFGYYCEWTNEVELLFSRNAGEGRSFVSEIVSASIKRGIFDKNLYEKYSILTSRGIQKRFFEATSRRLRIEVDFRYLLIDVTQIYINADKKPIYVDINSINADTNAQSKVKESKEKKKKSLKKKSDDEAGYADSDFSEVMLFYQENIGMPSTVISQRIDDWLKDVDKSLILYAIEQAVLYNRRNWSYIQAILNNNAASGIRTRAEAEGEEYGNTKGDTGKGKATKQYGTVV